MRRLILFAIWLYYFGISQGIVRRILSNRHFVYSHQLISKTSLWTVYCSDYNITRYRFTLKYEDEFEMLKTLHQVSAHARRSKNDGEYIYDVNLALTDLKQDLPNTKYLLTVTDKYTRRVFTGSSINVINLNTPYFSRCGSCDRAEKSTSPLVQYFNWDLDNWIQQGQEKLWEVRLDRLRRSKGSLTSFVNIKCKLIQPVRMCYKKAADGIVFLKHLNKQENRYRMGFVVRSNNLINEAEYRLRFRFNKSITLFSPKIIFDETPATTRGTFKIPTSKTYTFKIPTSKTYTFKIPTSKTYTFKIPTSKTYTFPKYSSFIFPTQKKISRPSITLRRYRPYLRIRKGRRSENNNRSRALYVGISVLAVFIFFAVILGLACRKVYVRKQNTTRRSRRGENNTRNLMNVQFFNPAGVIRNTTHMFQDSQVMGGNRDMFHTHEALDTNQTRIERPQRFNGALDTNLTRMERPQGFTELENHGYQVDDVELPTYEEVTTEPPPSYLSCVALSSISAEI